MTDVLTISDRKHDVLQRIQGQRLELTAEARLLWRALNPILTLRRGVLAIVDHPLLWMLSTGLVVFSVGPNRIVRILLSVWHALQIARFFKKRGVWSRQ
ncbi:MAG TPA: hypothetical protein VJS66_06510 [Burkholderiales bacterium]|nr:hypothetical protein [Burkholderiales bacterium]